VVGVVDDVPVVRLASFADVWVPLTTARSDGYRSEMVGDFIGLLLASDRSRFPQIKAEVASRFRDAQVPDPRQFEKMVGGADTVVEGVARFLGSDPAESRPRVLLVILGGAALAFMLLPAINLVNLNLSRILERASEIGVRKAFGASSRALVGQNLVENVLLTLIGGAIGLAVSALVLGAINRSGVIAYADFTVNLRVFAWGMALAVVFGLVSGVYPAWRMSRLQPAAALAGRS
jgi:putative ABC transport system permease protein